MNNCSIFQKLMFLFTFFQSANLFDKKVFFLEFTTEKKLKGILKYRIFHIIELVLNTTKSSDEYKIVDSAELLVDLLKTKLKYFKFLT